MDMAVPAVVVNYGNDIWQLNRWIGPHVRINRKYWTLSYLQESGTFSKTELAHRACVWDDTCDLTTEKPSVVSYIGK